MEIKWAKNTMPKSQLNNVDCYITADDAKCAYSFHKTIPGYKITPLVKLKSLAQHFGVGEIYVKDESKRFDLNAFKITGAGFAMAKYLSISLGKDISEVTFEELKSPKTKKKTGDITFYSATDGNHGRAVAWMASKLGYKAVINMPKGSTERRRQNILNTGAQCVITEMNYDDTVRYTNNQAKENNGIVVQDTAWKGYEEIPTWIMQGYSAMALEIEEQMDYPPTHIFLQAGVGSFASAIQSYYANVYKENPPMVVIVESDQADCFYLSALANDGKARFKKGDMLTLMAGLACGEPNTISFEIIKNHSAYFASCADIVTAYGMRILGNPMGQDERIMSGESGAVTTGLLAYIMTDTKYQSFRKELKLDKNSKILLISTEGDTDPECYRDVVWRGRNQYSK
ncbi:diaminopropionate ammonia-lyase [Oxobacter pfennigii]|uniref:Diaminopropionate ammonia-lyase n=2 Tax=Oxobacter pfennigii TaxID=36849 RepID=A0A0N8NT15_9CLOT|nr:diaminopropionate ammonia-lyase [Oxobacter pfennigii]KPU43568.1 diaminopropionate ammonia-lyase [Oxobacter pfennigii]